MRAGHEDAIAGRAPARRIIGPARNPAEGGDRDRQRARRRRRVAAQERETELRLIFSQAAREARAANSCPSCRAAPAPADSPRAPRPWPPDRRGSRARPSSRSASGGSSGRKCTPSTSASTVTTSSCPAAAREGPHRREGRMRPAHLRQRREQLGDQFEFTGTVRLGVRHRAAFLRIRRRACGRASRSRTAFTKPGSSPSKKACAISRYSSITTLAGHVAPADRAHRRRRAGWRAGWNRCAAASSPRPARRQRRGRSRPDMAGTPRTRSPKKSSSGGPAGMSAARVKRCSTNSSITSSASTPVSSI